MANSWLELQSQLRNGAANLPNPRNNDACTTVGTSTLPDSLLGLPDLVEATAGVAGTLSNIQNEIDNFGAEVMGVLQDIGAFIPPELQGFGNNQDQTGNQSTFKPAAVDKIYQENLGPEVSRVYGHNTQTGDGYLAYVNSSGSAFHLDADGSVIIRAAKNPVSNPKTGRFDVWADGQGNLNFGEFLAIEVKNNENIKGKKAFSLFVNGDIDVQSLGGTIALKGENIRIAADKSLELLGADIKIHAGAGQGTAKDSSTKPPEEAGGSLDVRCGSYKLSYASKQGVETASYAKSEGEVSFIMPNSQGNFSIESAGTLSIRTGGDMLEEIGGRKMTEVMNLPLGGLSLGLPTIPMISGVSAGYYIVNKNAIPPAVGVSADLVPPLVYIHSPLASGDGGSPGHGFRFSTLGKGDINFYSAAGNFTLANESNVVASILTPFTTKITGTPKILTTLKVPGMYLSSLATTIRLNSTTEVLASAGPLSLTPPVRGLESFIRVSPVITEISNKTGIFLN